MSLMAYRDKQNATCQCALLQQEVAEAGGTSKVGFEAQNVARTCGSWHGVGPHTSNSRYTTNTTSRGWAQDYTNMFGKYRYPEFGKYSKYVQEVLIH